MMNIPLTLYCHFPWCIQKCPYCDFNSHQVMGALPEKAYIQALIQDFRQDAIQAQGRTLQSIFFGGGTPSLLSPEGIQTFLLAVKETLPWDPQIEITLEANPGTFDQRHFDGYFAAGINRLSLGVQSFHNAHLKSLGRIHSAEEVSKTLHYLQQVGFRNFNLDLMYGLPHQTEVEALADLEQAIEWRPAHLSWYHLTIEPNTVFFHQRPPLPEDELIIGLEEKGRSLLQAAGFQQYEVSAYASPGSECRHNLNYWTFGDYLGVGAGAHGKITTATHIDRTWKVKHPKQYLQQSTDYLQGSRVLKASEIPFEFMLNALRLNRPISFTLFEERTFLDRSLLLALLEKAKAAGWLEYDSHSLTLTPLGRTFLNDVLELFME